MNEYDHLAIYDHEIAPLEQMIDKLKRDNAQLRAELASVKQKNAKLEQRIEALNNELESRASYYNTSGKWGEY